MYVYISPFSDPRALTQEAESYLTGVEGPSPDTYSYSYIYIYIYIYIDI